MYPHSTHLPLLAFLLPAEEIIFLCRESKNLAFPHHYANHEKVKTQAPKQCGQNVISH